MVKADTMFISRMRKEQVLMFGSDSKLITGLLVWFLLIFILFVIKRIYSRTVDVSQGNEIKIPE